MTGVPSLMLPSTISVYRPSVWPVVTVTGEVFPSRRIHTRCSEPFVLCSGCCRVRDREEPGMRLPTKPRFGGLCDVVEGVKRNAAFGTMSVPLTEAVAISADAVIPGRRLRSLFRTFRTVAYETTSAFVVDP